MRVICRAINKNAKWVRREVDWPDGLPLAREGDYIICPGQPSRVRATRLVFDPDDRDPKVIAEVIGVTGPEGVYDSNWRVEA